MNYIKHYLIVLFLAVAWQACSQESGQNTKEQESPAHTFEYVKSDAEWREILSPMAYKVLREKGTERAWTGEYNENKKDGVYLCAGCGNPLFDADTKFDSGTGWPSFYAFIGDTNVVEEADLSHGWNRTEVLCGRCGGHLGHVFEDGPEPTGLRYCINSVSLEFKEE